MTEDQVRARLKRLCERAGGQAEWSRAKGFRAQHVSDFIAGRRSLTDEVLAAIGVERLPKQYRMVRKGRSDGDD